MPGYEIILKPAAIRDLDSLRRYDATAITDGIERFLTSEPKRQSKSRIKRLRGVRDPDYRLRIGDFRIFYTVNEQEEQVIVLRVMHKRQTEDYYKELEP
jgi:mRNA interferase RelE/StbE